MYLWAVEHLFLGNELVRGEMTVDGGRVSLGAIRARVDAPRRRRTTTSRRRSRSSRSPTTSAPIRGRHHDGSSSGGHLGLFMGRDALATAWRPLFERLGRDVEGLRSAVGFGGSNRPVPDTLTGHVALVTGGVRGIGLAICERLAARGARRSPRLLAPVGGVGAVPRRQRRGRRDDPPGEHREQRGLRAGRRRGARAARAPRHPRQQRRASRWTGPSAR